MLPAHPAYLMALPTKIDPMLGYLTTGFHALHVTGGLIAFLFVLARTYAAKRFTHEQATSAVVVVAASPPPFPAAPLAFFGAGFAVFDM